MYRTSLKFRAALALLSILMFAGMLLFLLTHTTSTHALEPPRAFCGAIVQGSHNQPCLTQKGARKLAEFHLGAFQKSPIIETPLRWTLYSYCAGKGSMVLTVSDLQMPIEVESIPCGQYHEEQFYPLEDSVFFSANQDVIVQVWIP